MGLFGMVCAHVVQLISCVPMPFPDRSLSVGVGAFRAACGAGATAQLHS